MARKHFLSLKDFSREEIEALFDLAAGMKVDPAPWAEALKGQSLAMIFQKPSTRTRVSFEVGMFQLGGQALFLGSNDIQLHRGETVADTAAVLSRYVDGIMARVFAHQDVLDLARPGSVPVINGLSDLLHPCQALADYFTLRERRGQVAGLKMAYVGDGNNVAHELMFGAVKLGCSMSIGCPPGYEPNKLIFKSAAREAQKLRLPDAGGHQRPHGGGGRGGRRLHRRLGLDGPGGRAAEAGPGLRGLPGHAPSSWRRRSPRRSSCTACPPTAARRSTPR